MKAFNDLGTFEPIENVLALGGRSPLPRAATHTHDELHNARGLIVAVLLSAACWGVIGLALLV